MRRQCTDDDDDRSGSAEITKEVASLDKARQGMTAKSGTGTLEIGHLSQKGKSFSLAMTPLAIAKPRIGQAENQ